MSSVNIGGVRGIAVFGPGGGATQYIFANFLLRDDFLVDVAAPLASPRTCLPGPETLTMVQTDGQFSISSGKLTFAAQMTPAWGDQAAYSAVQARVAGRAVLGKINASGALGMFGWDVNQAALPSEAIYLDGSNNLSVWLPGPASAVVGAWAQSTDYSLAVVMRTTGTFMFIKGGAFTNWTLIWVEATATGTRYAAFLNYQLAGTFDNFRVIDFPAPFATDYGLATQRLAGSVAQGTTFVHEANCVIEFVMTTLPVGDVTLFSFRQQDANNRWYVNIGATGTIGLVEYVAGVATGCGSVGAGSVANGHRLVVVCDGTTIRVYSNNVPLITYSSASNFATATVGAATYIPASSAVSDIVSFPRTLTGAAASLLDSAVA